MSSTITIIGNITSAPEARSKGPVNFSIAVNRRWRDKNDEWQEQTSFIDCKAWNELGENIEASLSKGSRVIATGRLEQESWEKDGTKHSKLVLVVEDIGPSLRWATVDGITKVGKDGGQKSQSSGGSRGAMQDEEPF